MTTRTGTGGAFRPRPRNRWCARPGWSGLLTTSVDDPSDWIHAGQALQRALLLASSCHVAAALHSQPLEVPLLRDFTRIYLSDRAYPQMVLRFGATAEKAASMRRPVEAVLSSEE